MAAVLQEKEAAKERARLEWLGTVQRSGSFVGGEAGGRGNESGAGEPGDGGASGSPPASTAASQPERWAVDRARVPYERERAEYEDTKRLMGQVAAWTNPVVIHEHAIEQVPFGAATMRYHLIAIGVLTVVGLAALATGWRIKSRSRG